MKDARQSSDSNSSPNSKKDAGWRDAGTAPQGVLLAVRDQSGSEGVAIADQWVGWFNADRSGPPEILPAEWRPIAG